MKKFGDVLQEIRNELEGLAAYQAWCTENGLPPDSVVEGRMLDLKGGLLTLVRILRGLSLAEETPLYIEYDEVGGRDIRYGQPLDNAALRPYLATVTVCMQRIPRHVALWEGEYYVRIPVCNMGYFIKLTDFIPARLPTMVLVGESEDNLIFLRAEEVETYRLAAGEGETDHPATDDEP